MLLTMAYGIFPLATIGIICLFIRKLKLFGLYLFKSACGIFALIAIAVCYFFSLGNVAALMNDGLHPASRVLVSALFALVAACCIFLVSQFPFLVMRKSFFPKGRKRILLWETIVYFIVWFGGAVLLYCNLMGESSIGYDGNAVVRKINDFRKSKGRLPNGLEELDFKKSPEGTYVYRNGTFCYEKDENGGYILYYKGKEFWDSYRYESHRDKWIN